MARGSPDSRARSHGGAFPSRHFRLASDSRAGLGDAAVPTRRFLDSESVSGVGGRNRTPGARERELERLAGRQFGVIALAQLERIGFSYEEVRRRRERGFLIKLYRGVYAVGHRNIGQTGWLLAALLACGPNSFLSHRTAAGVWGMRALTVREIEVTVPRARCRSRPGLRLHRARTSPAKGEVSSRAQLRLSSPLRVLVELAARESEGELEGMIHEGVRHQVLAVAELPAMITRHRHRPGIAKLRAAAARYLPRPNAKSGLERSVDEWILTSPEIPSPQRNVKVEEFELDYYWPECRAAVELDGRPYHTAVADMERDHLKSARMAIAGIRLLRITDWRWEHDRAGAQRDILALLGRAV